MSLQYIIQSNLISNIVIAVLSIITPAIALLLRTEFQKLKTVVGDHSESLKKFLPDQAVKDTEYTFNDVLDAVEKLTEAAVNDANARIVNGMKEKKLFTPEVALGVKQDVIKDVLNNLGPLASKIPTIQSIIAQYVEMQVAKAKK